jgi:hypothetical protein
MSRDVGLSELILVMFSFLHDTELSTAIRPASKIFDFIISRFLLRQIKIPLYISHVKLNYATNKFIFAKNANQTLLLCVQSFYFLLPTVSEIFQSPDLKLNSILAFSLLI